MTGGMRKAAGRIGLVAAAALWLGAGGAAAQEGGATAEADGLTTLTAFAEFGEPIYEPGFTHFGYANPDAPKGGSITLGAFGTYERLDTITLGGPWASGIGLIGDSLMTGSGDELSAFYPLIAESVKVPEDLSYAIFTLHPDARWHDGHPITAEDFVFAFEHAKENGRPLLQEFWREIESATAISERELRFDFATTDNWRTLALAAGMSPEPVHWWEASDRDITESYLEPTLSEGPYRIADVDPGRSITYERVEDYWAAELPVNRGAYNFDRITYIYFRDIEVMFQAFLGGEFDFWSENRAQRWATAYDIPEVERGWIQREEFPQNQPRGYIGFVFNTRSEVFRDPRVRQAVGLLWDFEWTRDNVFYGQYTRAKSHFPNSDYGVTGFPLPEGTELDLLEPHRDRLPAALFEEPFTVPQTDGSGRIRAQLREALALFEEAGWEVRDGVMTNVETGDPFTFEFVENSDTLLRVVEPFARNLERAGITMDIRIVDSAQYERRTDDFDYDMIYIGANFFPPPGQELFTYFHSDAVDQRGSANWAGIENPVVDALLVEAIGAEDLETKKAATRAMDRVMLWQHYIIPSYYNDETWGAWWNKFGRPDRLPEYGVGFPTVWWYDDDLAAQLAE
jgi:microcin C transport system substrate-binding protein